MTTETYDKPPKLPKGLVLEGGDDKLPPLPAGLELELLKKKVGGVTPIPSDGTGGAGLSPLGDGINPFSYGALIKKPDEDKNRWVKAPMPIAKAVQEDKKKNDSVIGGVYNTVVGSVSRLVGGMVETLETLDKPLTRGIDKLIGAKPQDPNEIVWGNDPNAKTGRQAVTEFIDKARTASSSIENEQARSQFDITNGVQASDVKGLLFQAPSTVIDMLGGAYTAGTSFFFQSVNDNAKELEETPNAKKLTENEKLTYLFVQGTVQAALEKFGIDKVLKSTGLSSKLKQKLANEVTEEFIKKGIKATAKDIEAAALKKASSYASQIKRVGVKAATSFGVEATTEGAQQAASDGIKLLTNKISGNEIFDEEDITANFVKNTINAAAQGGVFGGGIGGAVGVLSNTKKAIRNEIAKATTPEDIQKMQSNIAEQVELGNITPQEAEAANITAQQYAEVAATIPQQIDADKKYALIGGIEQREELKREIAKVNEEMSAIDPAFHEDYISKTELLNAKLNQTNDYIDGIATGKKPTYRKEGDAYIKTDSKGETPISKEHYELATAVREEDAANNKMAEEVSKQEIKAAKILGKATLPDIMIAAAEDNPIGFVKTIAQQAQNLKEDGTPFNDGMEEAAMMATETTFGKEAVAEAIKLYPKQEPTPSMETTAEGQQEGATKGVVPSTLENVIEKGKVETNNYEDFKKEKNITDADIKTVPISDVGKYSAIDRNIEGQRGESAEKTVDKLANSIEQFGLATPIHIKTDGKNSIIEDGETRLAALNKLGVKDVPVYVEKVESFSERDKKLISQQQSTPTNEVKETTQVPDQAKATITEPTKPDKAGGKAKKSVLERPIEEVTIEDILKELEGDEGLAFKDVSNKDIKEGDGKDIEAYNQRAERVLKTLYPNAEFKALSTTKEYEQATGRKGEAGVLIRGKEGKHKLFLNLEAIINSDIERTATHEVVHALVSDAIGAKYVDLRKKWDSLLPKLYNVKGFEIVKEHIEKYSSADRPVEGITDLLANIVHDKIKIEDIPKNLWDEFIDLVNRAFEAIGIDYKITPDTFNGFASAVKEAFETGDFTNLKKFTSKSKTEKFFKEYPEFAEAASAMIDPEKRKQLKELLKTKIQQELNQGKISQDEANEFYRRSGIEPPTTGEGKDGGNGKKDDSKGERKFSKTQVLPSKEILPEVKRGVEAAMEYTKQTNIMSVTEAEEILHRVGLDAAYDLVTQERALKPAVRVVLGEILIKAYNKAAKEAQAKGDTELYNQFLDKTINTANYVSERLGTESGQMIQAFSLFSRLTPEAQLRAATKEARDFGKKKADKRKKDVDKIGTKLQNANEEAADELTKPGKLEKQVKKADNRVKKAKDKVEKAKEKRKKLIEKYKKGKGGGLTLSAGGLTTEGIEYVGEVAKTYIDEGLANVQLIAEKVIQSLKDVGAVINDEVVKGVGDIVKELVEANQNVVIKRELGELEKEVGRIVREHYKVPTVVGESLKQKFMNELDMDAQDAETLANDIHNEFDKIVTRKKQVILDREVSRFNRIKNGLDIHNKKKPKELQDDIIKYSNLGAFSNDQLIDFLTDKLDLKKLNPKHAAKIVEFAEKIQAAPEGSPKRDATQDLLAYKANMAGKSIAEVIQAIWYANILSGVNTHLVNVVSTFYNVVSFFATEAARNPRSIPVLMYGGARGLRRGSFEAWHTLMTGRSPIHISKVETPSILERTAFWGGIFNPVNWLKFVGRLMLSEDVLPFQALKEMRATQLAYKEARRMGSKNPFSKEVWKKIEEQLLNTKERSDEAMQQAEEEGLKKRSTEWKRRVYEVMENSRPVQMTENAYGFAAHGTFNHETEGTLGALTSAISTALDIQIGGTRPLRFVVPFTRIITNVVNNSLDFGPVGLVRAARGKRGFESFEKSPFTKSAYKEMTTEERKQTIAKASLGIALTGAIYALTKVPCKDGHNVLEVTGGGTGDFGKDEQLKATGWKPFSIRVCGGNYISYKFTPMVFNLSFIGFKNDREKYSGKDESFVDQTMLAMYQTGQLALDGTWVNSTSDFMKTLSEGDPKTMGANLEKTVAKMASQAVVPNYYIQGMQYAEEYLGMNQKEAKGTWEKVKQHIPVARNSMNNKINSLGEEVITDIDVFKSEHKPHKVFDYLNSKGAFVGTVNPNTFIIYDQKTNEERLGTRDEYYKFAKLRGQKIKDAMSAYIDGGFPINDEGEITLDELEEVDTKPSSDVSQSELKKVISRISSRATAQAKEELLLTESKE